MSGTGETEATQPSNGEAGGLSGKPVARAVAFLLALLAAGVLTLLVTATYGLTREYGFAASKVRPLDGLIVLALGGISLLLLLGARSQLGLRRPKAAALTVTVLAVFAGSWAFSGMLGGAAHDRRIENVASGCSAEDRSSLAAVNVPGFRLGPDGDPNGSCRLHIYPQTDPMTAVGDAVEALERAGWRPSGKQPPTTLERDGAVMTVAATSDSKVTDLVLELR